MSSSKVAMAFPSVGRSRRGLTASRSMTGTGQFVAHGWQYRWQQGVALVPSRPLLGQSDQRPKLPELFMRTVVPQLERRGARKIVLRAKPLANVRGSEVRWVAWHAPGDSQPVWGLFLSVRQAVLPGVKPANDTSALIAWGDGPALAWAEENPTARAALCAALRVPPPWLECGMHSGDPTFPVRIDRIAPVVQQPAGR